MLVYANLFVVFWAAYRCARRTFYANVYMAWTVAYNPVDRFLFMMQIVDDLIETINIIRTPRQLTR